MGEKRNACSIHGMPAMAVFHGGRAFVRRSGAMPAGRIVRRIRGHLPLAMA